MATLKISGIVLFASIGILILVDNTQSSLLISRSSKSAQQEIDLSVLRSKAAEAKKYCTSKGLNNNFYFLVDLKRHSGLKRFYIWDFQKDTLENSFLISHGCGDNPWGKDYSKDAAVVSNVDGSHKSSIGKYIIGKRGYSNWGINVNYLLFGQDVTNSNAYKRQIVLHSWEAVPDEEVYPNGTPEGWGCPALSNSSMRLIDDKIRNSKKKVLLWMIQ